MTFGELKELLPFIDVDGIDDTDIAINDTGCKWTIAMWLQNELVVAKKEAQELHENTMEGYHQVIALNTTHKTDGPASESEAKDFKHQNPDGFGWGSEEG